MKSYRTAFIHLGTLKNLHLLTNSQNSTGYSLWDYTVKKLKKKENWFFIEETVLYIGGKQERKKRGKSRFEPLHEICNLIHVCKY